MIYLIIFVSLVLFHFFKFIETFYSNNQTIDYHQDLLTLMDKLNYYHDNGICFGFTLTWAEASALGCEKKFYNTLDKIKTQKHDIPAQLKKIDKKLTLKNSLTTEEWQLYDIKPFFESISIAQSPGKFLTLFSKKTTQIDLNSILNLIQTKQCTNNQKVQCFFSKTEAFKSTGELEQYLYEISPMLRSKPYITALFSSEEHSVGFRRHHKKWLFIDINELYEQSTQHPFHLLSTKELSIRLYKSLFETSKKLIVTSNFMAANPSKQLIKQFNQLKNLYPITPKQIDIRNCRNISFTKFAIREADWTTVKTCLKLVDNNKRKRKSLQQKSIKGAIVHNHLKMFRFLIKQRSIDINHIYYRSDSRITILSIACVLGETKFVMELLRLPHININHQSKNGATPLMLACASKFTQNNPILFKVLLKAGASLNATDSRGDNALAIAKIFKNSIAINVISEFIEQKIQRQQLLGSENSSNNELKKNKSNSMSLVNLSIFSEKPVIESNNNIFSPNCCLL